MQSIWLTVDAPVVSGRSAKCRTTPANRLDPQGGKRERDMKEKIARDPVCRTVVAQNFRPCIDTSNLQPPKDAKRESGSASTSAAQFAYVDPNLEWDDIAWIQKIAPGKPIVIKGISCVEVGPRVPQTSKALAESRPAGRCVGI